MALFAFLGGAATTAAWTRAFAISVRHLPERRRFVATIDGTDGGFLEYEVVGEKLWDMTHTIVPPQQKGKGSANALARAALDHAKANDIRCILTCWFLADKFLPANPMYAEIVQQKS